MTKKTSIVVVVLIVLLVLAVGYIGYTKYASWKQQKDFGIYQQGAQFGYQQAVMQVFQPASQCQQVPITYNNQTINVVAVGCLKLAQG